jgi:hypothetical protein
MSNPESSGDPAYYKGPNWVDCDDCLPSGANDYCGAHTNDGVAHKWFYLLSDGDTYRDVTVTGIGVASAIQFVYPANAYYWTTGSDYHDAALGTYFAALDLDPSGVWADEVATAWLAVNIDILPDRLAFSFPDGVPRRVESQQTTPLAVEVGPGVGADPVAGSGQLHYSTNGVDYATVDMIDGGDNSYTTDLPAIICAETLNFYFSAQIEGGERFYFPDPASPYTAIPVRGLTASFVDDFETSTGWGVVSNVSQGAWERGVPASNGEDGAPPTDYDGSGQCFATGLDPYVNVDGGTTQLLSPIFDLTGTGGEISYAWWYHNRCAIGQIAGDPLYVYVSNDEGANWTLLEIIGPNPAYEGEWHESSFVVSDFVTPTQFMRLRFEISDTGLPTCSEAAIDAVTIGRYVCDGESTCCLGKVGDANSSGENEPTIGDVSILIDARFISSTCDGLIDCIAEADMNQSGHLYPTCDDITIGDISLLIDYLFISGSEAVTLPDCLWWL